MSWHFPARRTCALPGGRCQESCRLSSCCHWHTLAGSGDRCGALISICGTLSTSLIALLIGVPVSFGIAVFLTESCPVWLRRPLGTAIELLAGVPSLIHGISGPFIFVPLFARSVQPWRQSVFGAWLVVGGLVAGPPIGVSILAAGIVLALSCWLVSRAKARQGE